MTETADRPLTPMTEPTTLAAETFAWWMVGIAVAVAFFSALAYMGQVNDYQGDPTTALGWLTVALTLMGLMLVPALILTGMRQLLTHRDSARAADSARNVRRRDAKAERAAQE